MRRKPSRRITRFGIEPLDSRLLLSTLVALVDTGVDLNSSTDAPYYDLTAGYNAYTQQASTADGSNVADNSFGPGGHGHGSTVADSIVMGIKDTVAQPGAAGADVKIMPIRVTSDSGNLDGNSFGAVVRGIFYAAYHHASVINVSIVFLSVNDVGAHVPNNPDPSYTKTSPTFQDAIDYARSKGAVVVTGAGNNHYDLDSTDPNKNGYYPLHIFPTFNTGANLIVAASTEPSGDLTSISNYGATHVTLGSPAIQNATSYAAGYTTGVTGVIAALNPGLSAEGVAGIIKSSAQVKPQLQGLIATGAVISPANAVAASAVPPTIVASASAFPQTVTGSSTKLGVLGMSTSGEAGLSYAWSVVSGPAVTFSPPDVNGTNAGKNITAQFSQPGTYTFRARISASTGASVTSDVTVNVASVASSVDVTPTSAPVDAGQSETFSALARDQFGAPLASQPQFTWSVKAGGAGGTIDSAGKYTAPNTGPGQDIVSASIGSVAGTSLVSVSSVATSGPVAIDAGSSVGSGAFVADTDVDRGNTGSTAHPIDTSATLYPAPEAVYQSERWAGDAFTYTIGGLTPHALYTVRLHFAETFYSAPGSRQFNVTLNGALVLQNFDIFATAGGAFRGLTQSFSARGDDNGKVTITFTNIVGGASVSGIEVFPSPAAFVPPPPPIGAVALDQDGHDFANIRDLVQAVPGPDGLQDVHIRLNNLPTDTPIERVMVNRSGGGGLYRSDGSLWAWSTVVKRDSTGPGRFSDTADVYFQPNPDVVDRNHEYQVYIFLAGRADPIYLNVNVTDDPKLPYTPAVPPPPIEAVSLDQDGHDLANIRDLMQAVPGPDGLQDVHIRLSNLPEDTPIDRVMINRSGGGGLYRSDGSLWAWSTAVTRATTGPGRYSSNADVYFQPNPNVVDEDHEYQVYIFLAGQTVPVYLNVDVTDDPKLRYVPAVPPPPIRAVSLGQDGSDFANIFDLPRAVPGPDGLQDVHIRLANLPEDAVIDRVQVNRSGGGGLYRSDGSLWGWSTAVARAATGPGRLSSIADVYFQPNPGVVDDNHEYQIDIYFVGQTLPVQLFVNVTDDPSLRKQK